MVYVTEEGELQVKLVPKDEGASDEAPE
jgi:hypothetical protein